MSVGVAQGAPGVHKAQKTGAQEGSWGWGESTTAVLVLGADRKLGLPARTSIPPPLRNSEGGLQPQIASELLKINKLVWLVQT